MNASRTFLKAANSLISVVVGLFLLVAFAYSAYALWDNAQVYNAVDDVMDELMKLKPSIEEDAGPTFEELRAINPDVCAWVTLDGTEIDYPVLQGADNLEYINKDVYGKFSMSGSIFLDTSCSNTFNEKYALLYGHHMANDKMFGDLDLYEEEQFFNQNTTGTLILPDRSYRLEIFACLRVSSSDGNIFTPSTWQQDNSGLVTYARTNSMHLHEETAAKIGTSEEYSQILALSTCSSEYTDARTVLLAVMKPYSPET